MEQIKNKRKMWLIIGIVSMIAGVLSIIGIIMFATNKQYVLMGICIALVAHAFYGGPLYFVTFAQTGVYLRVIRAIEEYNLTSIEDISKYAMLKPDVAEGTVKNLIDRGYLNSYMLENGRLVLLESKFEAQARENKKCEYCGTKLDAGVTVCPSCGAAVDK